jgi:hypothetical protein
VYSICKTMANNQPVAFLHVLNAILLAYSYAIMHNDEDVAAEQEIGEAIVHQNNRRRARVEEDGNVVRQRRRFIKWDWEGARQAIQRDYYGPEALFNDRQFERIFRVSRPIADRLLTILGNTDAFFTQRTTVSGKLGICPKAKMLMALKLVGYGISPSGFQDYFQMGLPTAHLALRKFLQIVSSSDELRGIYLRKMTILEPIYLYIPQASTPCNF